MSSTNISEEVIRDRIISIVDTVGPDGRLDEDELKRVSKEAWNLCGDAKKLRWERSRRQEEGERA